MTTDRNKTAAAALTALESITVSPTKSASSSDRFETYIDVSAEDLVKRALARLLNVDNTSNISKEAGRGSAISRYGPKAFMKLLGRGARKATTGGAKWVDNLAGHVAAGASKGVKATSPSFLRSPTARTVGKYLGAGAAGYGGAYLYNSHKNNVNKDQIIGDYKKQQMTATLNRILPGILQSGDPYAVARVMQEMQRRGLYSDQLYNKLIEFNLARGAQSDQTQSYLNGPFFQGQ